MEINCKRDMMVKLNGNGYVNVNGNGNWNGYGNWKGNGRIDTVTVGNETGTKDLMKS